MTEDDEILREERDDTGAGTGVEVEDEEGERIVSPFDPDDIDVVTRSMTVNLLLSRLASGDISLVPEFQRKAGVWNDMRQSRLIESILLRIPLPSFYAAEDENEAWEMVDGVQRMTAIARFVQPDLVGGAPLRLTRLQYLPDEGKTYTDLAARLQRRIQETEFVFHLIRHGTPPDVKFNIFARINTGGMPLTYQEIRHALVPGPARAILADWAASREFRLATDHRVSPDRMADREMVLRFLAFRLKSYEEYVSGDLNSFLFDAMRRINRLGEDELREHRAAFGSAMETARSIWGNDAFRKRFDAAAMRSPINKALFEAIAVNLAALSDVDRRSLVARREDVVRGFISRMNEPAFSQSVSVGTGDPARVQVRFRTIASLFQQVLA